MARHDGGVKARISEIGPRAVYTQILSRLSIDETNNGLGLCHHLEGELSIVEDPITKANHFIRAVLRRKLLERAEQRKRLVGASTANLKVTAELLRTDCGPHRSPLIAVLADGLWHRRQKFLAGFVPDDICTYCDLGHVENTCHILHECPRWTHLRCWTPQGRKASRAIQGLKIVSFLDVVDTVQLRIFKLSILSSSAAVGQAYEVPTGARAIGLRVACVTDPWTVPGKTLDGWMGRLTRAIPQQRRSQDLEASTEKLESAGHHPHFAVSVAINLPHPRCSRLMQVHVPTQLLLPPSPSKDAKVKQTETMGTSGLRPARPIRNHLLHHVREGTRIEGNHRKEEYSIISGLIRARGLLGQRQPLTNLRCANALKEAGITLEEDEEGDIENRRSTKP
eukprot:4528178-Amphidinium_carterae.1